MVGSVNMASVRAESRRRVGSHVPSDPPSRAGEQQRGKARIAVAASFPAAEATRFRGSTKAPPRPATNRHAGANRNGDVTSMTASLSLFLFPGAWS